MTAVSSETKTRTAFLALDFVTLYRRELQPRRRRRGAGGKRARVGPDRGPAGDTRRPGPTREKIHPLLAPVGDEPVLGKTAMGAFATTNLDELLRADGVGRVVLAGVATSGTVLSTARWAFDVGYEVVICADACADPDKNAHAALVDESVFPESWIGLWRIARMVTSAQITDFGL